MVQGQNGKDQGHWLFYCAQLKGFCLQLKTKQAPRRGFLKVCVCVFVQVWYIYIVLYIFNETCPIHSAHRYSHTEIQSINQFEELWTVTIFTVYLGSLFSLEELWLFSFCEDNGLAFLPLFVICKCRETGHRVRQRSTMPNRTPDFVVMWYAC